MNTSRELYEAHIIRAFNAVDKAWDSFEDFEVDELVAHIDGLASVLKGEIDSKQFIESTHLSECDKMSLM